MKSLIKTTLLLLALLLPASAAAFDFMVDGIYYNINGNEASVTKGNGYESYSGDVAIPETVTYDGVTYTVTAISGSAFFGCKSLTSVTIGNEVVTIGPSAFAGCSALMSATIGSSVTSIGDLAFMDCTGLSDLTIGNKVITIGSKAFYACDSLKNVVLPNSVTTIGSYAFAFCCGLTGVTISNSVTDIPEGMFYKCSGMTSVTIPKSIAVIGARALAGCSALESIMVENGNPSFDSRSNCNALIVTASNTLIVGCKNTIVPNTVTSIGDDAFFGCDGLTEVTIPNSVTSIGKNAFDGCSGLVALTIPNSVTTIGSWAFSGCDALTSVIISSSVTAINSYVFNDCIGLTSVTIPNSVTSIGDGAFSDCSSLTSLTIGNSVKSIGRYAFSDCVSLTSVTFPNSVTSIADGAFARCGGLTALTIPSSVITIGKNPFLACDALVSITVENNNPKYDSRDDCNAIIEKASNTLITGCQNTIIPNTVTSIGEMAFNGCSTLTTLTIPNSVIAIGNSAFEGCSGLTGMVIPNSITSIGNDAFSGCCGLTYLSMSNSVTTIGDWAFISCTGLTSVTIPNSLTSIGYAVFSGCYGLTDFYSYLTDFTDVSISGYAFGLALYHGEVCDYSNRTLHVPQGTVDAYQADSRWYPYFGQIVEMEPETGLTGDVNHDGEVNIADVNAVVDIILGGNGDFHAADVNGDGEINIADLNAILHIIMGGGGPSPDEHEWVDLGLPSGTLWATCNLGASSPEEYGDYFAWGETEPKDYYDWNTYKWCNGSSDTLTKYCTYSTYGTVDNKTELDLEDDAAYVNWGPAWQMPSRLQIEELVTQCTLQRSSMNGLNGWLFIGPNGNTMFLPGADYRSRDSSPIVNSYYSCYWTRTVSTGYPVCANYLFANGIDFGMYYTYGVGRNVGNTVRAVRIPQD